MTEQTRSRRNALVSNLGALDFFTVVQIAKDQAAGTQEDWARAVGEHISTVRRAMAPGDRDYFVSFRRVPALCLAMGTPLVLEWALARYHYLAAQEGLDLTRPLDPAAAVRAVGALAREAGQACDELATACADGALGQAELPGVRAQLGDVLRVVLEALSGVDALDQRLDRDAGRTTDRATGRGE